MVVFLELILPIIILIAIILVISPFVYPLYAIYEFFKLRSEILSNYEEFRDRWLSMILASLLVFMIGSLLLGIAKQYLEYTYYNYLSCIAALITSFYLVLGFVGAPAIALFFSIANFVTKTNEDLQILITNYIYKISKDYNRYHFSITKILITAFWSIVSFLILKVFSKMFHINILDNLITSFFPILLISLLINLMIFLKLAYGLDSKQNQEEINKTFHIMKPFLGLLLSYLILSYLTNPNINTTFINIFILSSILFYYYKKQSDFYLKHFEFVKLYEEDSKEENNFSDLISFKPNDSKIQNPTYLIKSEILKNSPFINDLLIKLINFSKVAVNFKTDAKLSKGKKENDIKLMNNFISTLDKIFIENSGLSFENKVDILVYLFYSLIRNGQKFGPMLLLAFLVYHYSNTHKENPEKDYLKNKIKELINNKTLNTPKRMSDFLFSWQYLFNFYNNTTESIKKLPKFVKKSLKKVLEDYSPLTLKKNKLLRKTVKLKDLIKVLHPKPKDSYTSLLYSGIIQDTKISKLKPTEYFPIVLKDEELALKNIDIAPIWALIRNISSLNFQNPEIYLGVQRRLKNILENIDSLRRFINILDFYIPIFIISKDDIIKISENLKNHQLKILISKELNIKKITFQSISISAINMVFDNINLINVDFEKVKTIAHAIDSLLILEKIISISMKSPNLGIYTIKDLNFQEIKNRQKIKEIIDNCLDIYFQNNLKNEEINIIIRPNSKSDFAALAKILSFLTSKYPKFKLFNVSNKIEEFTDPYKKEMEKNKPITNFLKTFVFIAELSRYNRDNEIFKSYGLIYEYIKFMNISKIKKVTLLLSTI